MLSKFVLGMFVAAALTAGGVLAAEKAAPAKEAGDCCAQKLACCNPQSACCKAEKKPGCCAKGQKCCAENRACCGDNPPACCVKGEACCDGPKDCCGPVQKKDAQKKDGKHVAVSASCCAAKPTAKPACCVTTK